LENHESSRPHLSVVIPAYNEESRIAESLDTIIKYLEKQPYTFEVFIVDDGSSDNTADICSEYSSQHSFIKFMKLPVNQGKGCAVRTGMLHASGNYLLMSDADLATPIEELDGFWQWIDEGFDIVIASRAIDNAVLVEHQPFHREFGGRVFNLIVQASAVPGIKDTQCGFKLFTRKSSDAVFSLCTSNGFGFDIEALFLARALKFRIKEAPVHWCHKEGSKVKVLRDGPSVMLDILRIRLRHAGNIRLRD